MAHLKQYHQVEVYKTTHLDDWHGYVYRILYSDWHTGAAKPRKIGQPVGFQHPCLLHSLFAWTEDLWKWRSWEKRTSSGWKYSKNMNGERTSIGNKMACLKQYMKRKCTIILMIVNAFLVSMFAGSYILADTRLPLTCTVAAKNKENWIRFGLWVFNVSSAVVVIILWICWQRIHDKR